jgi:primosomal protein N' (replication factor Y) (superfamily II helicase)
MSVREGFRPIEAGVHAELLGPVEPNIYRTPSDADQGPLQRLTLRAPLSEGPKLVQTTKEAAAIRSARKSSGSLRIKVNPADLS